MFDVSFQAKVWTIVPSFKDNRIMCISTRNLKIKLHFSHCSKNVIISRSFIRAGFIPLGCKVTSYKRSANFGSLFLKESSFQNNVFLDLVLRLEIQINTMVRLPLRTYWIMHLSTAFKLLIKNIMNLGVYICKKKNVWKSLYWVIPRNTSFFTILSAACSGMQ